VSEEGDEKGEIKPGDVIRTPPGMKHWQRATATSRMSHIAIMLDGEIVERTEHAMSSPIE
jgi:quercetin dioxygenase-like cupin family protein